MERVSHSPHLYEQSEQYSAPVSYVFVGQSHSQVSGLRILSPIHTVQQVAVHSSQGCEQVSHSKAEFSYIPAGQLQSGSFSLGASQTLQSSAFASQVSHLYPHSSQTAYVSVAPLSVYPSLHSHSGSGVLRVEIQVKQLVAVVSQVAHLQSQAVQSITPSTSSK